METVEELRESVLGGTEGITYRMDADAVESFEEALNSLGKSATVLILGRVDSAQVHLCERALGDPMHNRERYRVLGVGPADSFPVADRIPTGADTSTDRLRIVAQEDRAREGHRHRDRGAGSDPGRNGAAGPITGHGLNKDQLTVTDSGILDWAQGISDAIEELEPDQGYRRGDLRVCLSGLHGEFAGEGVDDTGGADVLEILSTLTHRHLGMLHVHLPTRVSSAAVDAYRDQADVVVEVADRGDGIKQRWSVLGETSEWLPVGHSSYSLLGSVTRNYPGASSTKWVDERGTHE